MSPFPPVVHTLAAALAVVVGLWLMSGIAPDLPSGDPGVSQAVSGPGDPDSFLSGLSFSSGLSEVGNQLGDDDVKTLDITPGKIHVETGSYGTGTQIADISDNAPFLLAVAIGNSRGAGDTFDESRFESMHYESDGDGGGVWTVHLLPTLPGPHTYTAELPDGVVASQVKVTAVPGS